MVKTISVMAGLAAVAAASIFALPAFSRIDTSAVMVKTDRADATVRCEFRDWPRHKAGCLAFHPNFDELSPPRIFVSESFAWPAAMADGEKTVAVTDGIEAPSSWQMSDREIRLMLDAGDTTQRVGS